ncbi:MAG: hypothetical protein ABWZ57_17255 [Mesorhizobium sp.]
MTLITDRLAVGAQSSSNVNSEGPTMRMRRYTKWTDEEIVYLRHLAGADLRAKAIARQLRRPAEAVRRQARQSGIRLREDRLLASCVLAGFATASRPVTLVAG